MEEYHQDLIAQIWKENKKVLGYGEIDYFFRLLKNKKPELKEISYLGSKTKPISIRKNGEAFDENNNIQKRMEVYFLDHFENTCFLEEISSLYSGVKTLLRNDLILNIYDTYTLSVNPQCKMYFVIEQEYYDCTLRMLFQDKLDQVTEELKEIMETAINYCSDRSNLKQQNKVKNFSFPNDFLKYFVMINDSNSNKLKIKLNALSTDLFENLKHRDFQDYEGLSPQTSKKKLVKMEDKEQLKLLNEQMNSLLLDVKNLNLIKKENLVQSIEQNFEELLQFHGKEIFQIIAQHPKYNEFELVEFDQNFIIFGTSVNGQHYNIKCEKFNSLKEVEEMVKLYEQYYSIQDHMFVPVNSYDSIIVENGYYLLIEEVSLPYVYQLNQKNIQNSADEYNSLDQILLYDYDKVINRVRQLQIVVQLFKARQILINNDIFHGSIAYPNTIVQFSAVFSAKLPQIYFTNPLFLRSKMDNLEDGSQRDLEYDYIQINTAIYILMIEIYTPVIEATAAFNFFLQQHAYFQKLLQDKQKVNDKKQMEVIEENQKIHFYLERLKDFFQIYEQIYQNELSDRYISMNSKWLICIKKYLHSYLVSREQCKQPRIFEMKVDKIQYDFKNKINEKIIEIIKAIQRNSNLISIDFKFFRSSPILNENCFNQDHMIIQLENALRNSKNLQKLKLEVVITDSRLLDLKSLFKLDSLQHIKLSLWIQLRLSYYENEKVFIQLVQHLRDLILLFTVQNRKFKSIDITPYNAFMSSFQDQKIGWVFDNLNAAYNQVKNNLQFMNQPQKVDKYSYFATQTISNAYIVERISRQENQIDTIKYELNGYFLQLQNNQNSQIIKQSKQSLLEQLSILLSENLYLSCIIKKNERNQLIIEFENVLDDEMGKFIVKLEFQNQEQLLMVSQNSQNQERFNCFYLNPDTCFHIESVRQWILCNYEKMVKENLFGNHYESICFHSDLIEFQKCLFKNQDSLQKFTLYIDQCPYISQQLLLNKDFFGFSQMAKFSLIELNLKLNIYNIWQRNTIYKDLRMQLENAKYLRVVQIDRRYRQLKTSLLKLKRLVKITINKK